MLDQGVVLEVINHLRVVEVFDQGVVLESVLKHSTSFLFCLI
jgi:hypothetical protein